MRVVIAMDSFKGSLSSIEAGKAVAEGVRRADGANRVRGVPCGGRRRRHVCSAHRGPARRNGACSGHGPARREGHGGIRRQRRPRHIGNGTGSGPAARTPR